MPLSHTKIREDRLVFVFILFFFFFADEVHSEMKSRRGAFMAVHARDAKQPEQKHLLLFSHPFSLFLFLRYPLSQTCSDL